MTINIGWWLIPLLVTVVSFTVAVRKAPQDQRGGYVPDVISPMLGAALLLIAAIVSLFAWLIWALVS